MDSEEICKTCGRRLVQKTTKRTAEQLKKPYYYSAYYYCPHCQKLYHNDKFKVVNSKTLPLNLDSLVDTKSDGSDEDFDVEIWTDGSCVANGTDLARAAWAFVSGKTEKAGLVEGKQTNNVAEGLAIYHALLWAGEKGYKKIKLSTDSQISLHNVGKAAQRVKLNREIFLNIEKVINDFGLTVTYVKVLGHSGDMNNERADKLATELAAAG